MEFIGVLTTYFITVMFGLYLNDVTVGYVLSTSLGFSGSFKRDKELTILHMTRYVGATFGSGATVVAYKHGFQWPAVAALVLVACLVPSLFFFIVRVARRLLIALDKLVDTFFSTRD